MTQTATPLLLHLGAPPPQWPADLAAHAAADRMRIVAAADIYALVAALLSIAEPVAGILVDPQMLRPHDARALESLHGSTGAPIYFFQPPSAAMSRLLPSARIWPGGNMEELGDLHKKPSPGAELSLDADAPARYDDSSHVMLTDEEVRALLGSPD